MNIKALVIVETYHRDEERNNDTVRLYSEPYQLRNSQGVDVLRTRPEVDGGEMTEVSLRSCIVHDGIALYICKWTWNKDAQAWEEVKNETEKD